MDANLEKVKQRVKKLLNLAQNDGAQDGEIAAAMQQAEAMMEKYHLAQTDVAAAQIDKPAQPEHFEKVGQAFETGRLSQWENHLYHAVKTLVGSVDAVRGNITTTFGAFKQQINHSGIYWYGPAEDARLAAELFADWSSAISTMATGKFASCTTGHGARYALGFATALHEQATDAAVKRATVVTPSTTAIVCREGGSLAEVLALKRASAKAWVEKKDGKLRNRGKTKGYTFRGGDESAYSEGRVDGAKAEFNANRTKKLDS